MIEEYVTKYADDKLTVEEVKQAINYVIKNNDSAIIYSSLSKEEFEESYDDCECYNEVSEIELFSKELADDNFDDEEQEQQIILQVGVFGDYIYITADDVIDKSLTDCVVDLISDFVKTEKKEIKMEISDKIDDILDKKSRQKQEEYRDVIEFLVKEYKEKNYNMTALKARLKKYFDLV